MDGLEIDDGGSAADVEQVLAHAEVASATSLLATEVSEAVLDGDALAESLSPFRGSRELS